MTFKHVKFEDSVVMRSLEKLAKEKGLVKEEPVVKTASNKLAPSANLTENVLNLCAGLRERGFHKAASDLESKFMTLKQAQTLYETSKEKGEDLIDAAHPKGSHKIEDIDGDELAVVETILDQHLKSIKMVEKQPTGKLASSFDVLNAVKVVLAQDAPKFTEQQVTQWYISQTMAKIEAGLNTARQGHAICYNAMKAGYVEQDRTFGSDLGDIGENVQKATNAMYTMRSGGKADPSVEAVNAMIEGINGAIGRLDAFGYEAASQAMRNEAHAKFTRAIQILEEAKATIRSYQSQTDGHTTLPIGVIPPQAPASTLGSTYRSSLQSLKARYDTFIVREDWSKVPKANQQKLIDWLGNTKELINKWNKYLDEHKSEEDLKSVKSELDAGIAEVKRRLDVYQNSVVNKAPQQTPGGTPPGGTTNNPNAVAQK